MRIYTKTGDLGTTQLGNGKRVSKDRERIVACGTIDELNSFLGFACTSIKEDELKQKIKRVQEELQRLNAQLALAPNAKILTMRAVLQLEQEIDVMSAALPELHNFIVPQGILHVVRSVCRRAERAVVVLKDEVAITYLNRLSDWLFTMARLMEMENE